MEPLVLLIFFKEKLAFLSVPKTGSTAWQQALSRRADIAVTNPPELKHAPVYRYNRFFRPMFKNVSGVELDLMAVMREPKSWLGSWYRYRQRPEMEGHVNSTVGLTFDDFVAACCEKDPPAFASVGRQEKFLRAQENGTAVRYLFAYERPEVLCQFLSDRLGTLPPLQRVNVSPQADLTLSAKTEAKLRQKFAKDFALYDSLVASDH